jgi:CRP/FNR family transcriptional regulator
MRDHFDVLLTRHLPACAACQIRSFGICANSGKDELAWLEQAKIYRRYSAGDTIALAGGRLPFVGSVMLGIASLSRILKDGRQQNVGLLMPGDFLGRPGRQVTLFTVTALTDMELCGFQHRVFDELLTRAPDLRGKLVEVMLDELDAARFWMVTLGRKTAREKLCSLLIHFADHQERGHAAPRTHGAQTIALALTREQISDCLALTLETVSRQFSSLAQDGLIRQQSKHVITILDHARLRDAAAEDSDGGMWS